MENKTLAAAIRYMEKGYSVIPLNPYAKKPFFAIEKYQTEKPSQKDLENWWREFPTAMVGIMTGKISGLFVLDQDPNYKPEQVAELIPKGFVTPTSLTPRKGNHLYFRDPCDDRITVKAGLLPSVDYRCNGGFIVAPPSRNGYGHGYEWLPGLSIFELDPAPMPGTLYNYILTNLHYRNKENLSQLQNVTFLQQNGGINFFAEGRRDEDLFHLAHCLLKGKIEDDMLTQVMNIIGQNCDPPFPQDEIVEKIKSALKRAKTRERNLTEDISNWVRALQTGYFSVTESYKELQLVTKEEKNAARQVYHRLCKDQVIEKYGDKTGTYRIVEANTDEIDFMTVDEKVVDLIWPFEIQKWVKILPKNIIVIAGMSNAGKTAFLLNTCFMNMGRFKINYFSSEMGPMELRDRLNKFGSNLKHWKENINFRERSLNFSDVIKPNDVNIIDFLEITDEFYKIGGMIKEIWDKLKKGVAIIALQKNPNTDFGLGGMRSVEKARLYLAIDDGVIKIVKGKNWACETNPNGLHRSFKLIQGATFKSETEWER